MTRPLRPHEYVAKPGMPHVEEIPPDVTRWTFASADRSVQDEEFDRWLGWFGHDERDKPHSVDGKVWLVRRRAYPPGWH